MKKICWNCHRWEEHADEPEGGVCVLDKDRDRYTEGCERYQPPPPPEEIPTVGE